MLRGSDAGRVPRHSSGWNELMKYLRSRSRCEFWTLGPPRQPISTTSPASDTASTWPTWLKRHPSRSGSSLAKPGEEPTFAVDRFLESNLNFSGRMFDVVILGIPQTICRKLSWSPSCHRIHQVLQPGGLILAFFHQTSGPDSVFCRYHLTDTRCSRDAAGRELSSPQHL